MAAGLTAARRSGVLAYLRPDGKSQISVVYDGDRPVAIDTVLISAQHDPGVNHARMLDDIRHVVVMPNLPEQFTDDQFRLFVNPSAASARRPAR